MATIIENGTPVPSRNVYITSEDSSSTWAVVVLVLVVAIIGGAIWYMRYYRPATTTITPGATVQVNMPSSGYPPAQSQSPASSNGQ